MSPHRFLIETGYGFVMGAATLVPGLSAGTVAFVFGIYPRVIAALAALNADWWRALCRWERARLAVDGWQLLLALGIGMGMALVLLVGGLLEWIQLWPQQFRGLFCGMILGSILLFLLGMGNCTLRLLWWLLAGAITGMLLLTGLSFVALPVHPAALFLAGMIALATMLIPGLSGAYVLLLLGLYETVLTAVDEFRLELLVPFAAGGLLGLLLFTRLLNLLLQRYQTALLLFINGLLLVSLQHLWPFTGELWAATNRAAGIAVVVGLAITLGCGYMRPTA